MLWDICFPDHQRRKFSLIRWRILLMNFDTTEAVTFYDSVEHGLPNQWYRRSRKKRDFLVFQNVHATLSTLPNSFWIKVFFVLNYFCVLVLKTHIAHIFSIGLAAWRASPEHIIEYWNIHPAVRRLPRSFWEEDIPDGETFEQPSTWMYIIPLAPP